MVRPIVSGNQAVDGFTREVSRELERLASDTSIGVEGSPSQVLASELTWDLSSRITSSIWCGSLRTVGASAAEIVRVEIPPSTSLEISYDVHGSDPSDCIVRRITALYLRVGSAAPTRIGGTTRVTLTSGGAGAWTVSDAVSGSDYVISVTGAGTVDWHISVISRGIST